MESNNHQHATLQMMGGRLKMVHGDVVDVRSQEDLLEVTDSQMSENKSKCLWVRRAAKVQIVVWKIVRQFILVYKNIFFYKGMWPVRQLFVVSF